MSNNEFDINEGMREAVKYHHEMMEKMMEPGRHRTVMVDGDHYKREFSDQFDLGEWEGSPVGPTDFTVEYQRLFNSIPAKHRSRGEVVLIVEDDGYGESYRQYFLQARYLRPETEEERLAREEYQSRVAREAEDRERAKYEALKARFENG